ncbi:MAG: methylenetetrahydrofolate reductase [NAD(P)H] [Spartobacteria bacterium]|nr:methylenetetrahydrofolate reductase [NAD(P)H] [Spartobacteria bacterium]
MSDRTITELLDRARGPLFSLEFFPPKDYKGFALLGSSIERMRSLQPDFVSVTYGAGGSTRQRTLDIAYVLRKMKFRPVMPHLTCVGSSRAMLCDIVDEFYELGFRNIMCLRGDPPQGADCFVPPKDGLSHAAELVALVKERKPDICCGVACYPECHPEAPSLDVDIERLKEKLDAGASFATSQLFFESRHYFQFVEKCRAAGITQPILPGVMPPVSLKQVDRMLALSNASFPEELGRAMDAVGGSGPVAEAVGMNWMITEIDKLLEGGAPGIHLYILNRATTANTPALLDCLQRWRV